MTLTTLLMQYGIETECTNGAMDDLKFTFRKMINENWFGYQLRFSRNEILEFRNPQELEQHIFKLVIKHFEEELKGENENE